MTRKERIDSILRTTFTPEVLEVRDDSHQHAGHNPAAKKGETHYHILIVSAHFAGKPLVERHRMINTALADEFKTGLHALQLIAKTPNGV